MKSRVNKCAVIVFLLTLNGCMMPLQDKVSASLLGTGSGRSDVPGTVAEQAFVRQSESSAIISALRARPSMLVAGTPYGAIADAVMASDSRVADAELHVAVLRAEAARQNWLPRLGPNVSLNSLGDLVTEILIRQVLFDNGRKIAERDLAKANVEIAAVALVEESNNRVYEALSLYLEAERNRQLQAYLDQSLHEMAQFEWVMQQRVDGGVSDMSDLNVLQQKRATLRARASEAGEAAQAAQAELDAMADLPLGGLTGFGGLIAADAGRALPVLRAEAERDKAVAEARIARAAHLPGLAARASTNGDAELEVTSDTLSGLGSLATIKAIAASQEVAERRIVQADEAVRRDIAARTRQVAAYARQTEEAKDLTADAKQTLELFEAQFEGGQRQVMDLVVSYESFARALETEITLKYKTARAELDLARLRGALAEGARV
jgi:adhesin transport system outer membrane protein